ncbi:MAG: DUF4344 domain-containing metallopeptidase [Alphaproteobacteria bacterium]|nr:DUF4344 domain-containing metallopeptidase [Alphaproteobacteria bacterium]
MRNQLAGLIALVAGLAAGPMDAIAQDLTREQVHAADEFAVNNTWFVLYHELGHMLVDQLGLPVLGREEDAVDNIATFALLALGSDTSDQALIDASHGWMLSDARYDSFYMSDFYDEHSLDLQRAFAITCLMVGNDRKKFRDAADHMEMDTGRQRSCADDYAQVETSLVALLSPYIGEGAPIEVVYEDGGADFGWAERILKRSKILEKTAEDIGSSFALPAPITIRATLCDEANAFYDSETREVLVCYELIGDYFDMLVADMRSEESD